jgi:hypothetical protein
MKEQEKRALENARVVADAALLLSQHLLTRLALEQADPAAWLKETFDVLNEHIDGKTMGEETSKWAAVRMVVSETSLTLANEIAALG